MYVIRTSLADGELDAAGTVCAYKRLSTVERAFRSLQSVDLKVRPVFHRTAERVRAHVLVCMLAYYVEWHMRRRLAPLVFDDEDRAGAEAARSSVVAPAQVSESSRRKARRKRADDGRPVHSFRTLLGDLATLHEEPRGAPSARCRAIRTPHPTHRTAARSVPVTRREAAVVYPATNRQKSVFSRKINMLARADSGSSGQSAIRGSNIRRFIPAQAGTTAASATGLGLLPCPLRRRTAGKHGVRRQLRRLRQDELGKGLYSKLGGILSERLDMRRDACPHRLVDEPPHAQRD